MNKEFGELTDQEQADYYEFAADLLGDTLICDRTWSAWGVGTMTESDFSAAHEDDDFVHEIAEKIYKHTRIAKNEGIAIGLDQAVELIDKKREG